VVGEVKEPIIKTPEDFESYVFPWEMLTESDFSDINQQCKNSDKFMLANTFIRPFERMQFLRGTEELFVDLAFGEDYIYKFRDRIHEFNMRELEKWMETDVDGIRFMDDWGSQQSLLISPALWREFFKPLYKDYCDLIHKHGKYALFHSDGFIESIYPDLIEIGIDAQNSQLFCMDIEKIAERYGKDITFWGEIDRQYILPFGTEEDVENAVNRAAKSMLKHGKTGIIAQCEFGMIEPVENIEKVYERWDKY